jgi:hypothetical protein
LYGILSLTGFTDEVEVVQLLPELTKTIGIFIAILAASQCADRHDSRSDESRSLSCVGTL